MPIYCKVRKSIFGEVCIKCSNQLTVLFFWFGLNKTGIYPLITVLHSELKTINV